MNNFEIKSANSDADINGILSLQRQNLSNSISKEELKSQGFVTVEHDFELLSAMNQKFPHIIAQSDQSVVAYALVMLREFADKIPVLIPMFNKIESLKYKGLDITPDQYFIMGQVCVAKDFRSQGVFAALYQKMQQQMKGHFDYIITEIAEANPRSLRAHEKVGFETIHIYQSKGTVWHIVLLDLNK